MSEPQTITEPMPDCATPGNALIRMLDIRLPHLDIDAVSPSRDRLSPVYRGCLYLIRNADVAPEEPEYVCEGRARVASHVMAFAAIDIGAYGDEYVVPRVALLLEAIESRVRSAIPARRPLCRSDNKALACIDAMLAGKPSPDPHNRFWWAVSALRQMQITMRTNASH